MPIPVRRTTVLLFGYDPDEQELRGVGWDSADDWRPVELRRFVAEGYGEAKEIALSLVDRTALKGATPEQACELLAGIIRQVATRVNGNVSTIVIRDPSKERVQ